MLTINILDIRENTYIQNYTTDYTVFHQMLTINILDIRENTYIQNYTTDYTVFHQMLTINILDIRENTYIQSYTDHLIDPIEIALHKFDSQPNILKIRERVQASVFSFSNTTEEDLNPKKATSNSIPIKIFYRTCWYNGEYFAEHIDITGIISHKIVNQEISNSHFPDKLKLAELSPLQKDGDVMERKNYRPVIILPSVSKIYERLMQYQIVRFIADILYVHMRGYQKSYSTKDTLLTLVERWKGEGGGGGY